MAISNLPNQQVLPAISTEELPNWEFNNKKEISEQIATHLKLAFKLYAQGCPASLRIPSAMELSVFYRYSILDVLDALFELKNQHYEYVMYGLDAEIILHDPLCRIKNRHEPVLWKHRYTKHMS